MNRLSGWEKCEKVARQTLSPNREPVHRLKESWKPEAQGVKFFPRSLPTGMADPSGWLSYRAGFVQRESVMNILNFNMKFQLSVILDFLCLLAWNHFSLNFILTFYRYKPRAHEPTSSPGRFSLALEVGRGCPWPGVSKSGPSIFAGKLKCT